MIEKKVAIVTGGAGFIGSHLVDALVKCYEVRVIDNLSTGFKEYVNESAVFINADITKDDITPYFADATIVFHLAANADVSIGAHDPYVHVEQNILATHNVLEAMRKNKVNKIVFSSSSTIYGRAPIPTHESYGPLIPESLYGASKLACEAMIASYCHTYDFQSWVYRFANIIGKRSNHGVLIDFVNKLKKNPLDLIILGNGKQNKSYMYVKDCIRAMLYVQENTSEKVNIFNLGSGDQVDVITIAKLVSEKMGISPKLSFTGGEVGWKGDIPTMLLSTESLEKLGWTPKYTSSGAIMQSIEDILESLQD